MARNNRDASVQSLMALACLTAALASDRPLMRVKARMILSLNFVLRVADRVC